MKLRPQDAAFTQELLGYLNFSGGRPDPKFQRNLDEFWQVVPAALVPLTLRQVLAEADVLRADFGALAEANRSLQAHLNEAHSGANAHAIAVHEDTRKALLAIMESSEGAKKAWAEARDTVRGAGVAVCLGAVRGHISHPPPPPFLRSPPSRFLSKRRGPACSCRTRRRPGRGTR